MKTFFIVTSLMLITFLSILLEYFHFIHITYYLTISISQALQCLSSLRLFRPPLTQTQRGLQDHKKKIKSNESPVG